jgi:hypothetical protein
MLDLLAILSTLGIFAVAVAFAAWLDRVEHGGSP